METVLYIAGAAALIALTALLFRLWKTLSEIDLLLRNSQIWMDETRKGMMMIADDVHDMKSRMVPVINTLSDITARTAVLTEGLQSRVDTIYETIDDALDVARGAIDDIDRIKNEIVATVQAPIHAARQGSEGLVSTIVKGVGFVKEIIASVKK
jgi:uncharacterized protein YoxC